MRAYVVAGVDGSASGVAAAQYAADWAALTGRDLHLVRANPHGDADPGTPHLAEHLCGAHPGLAVTCREEPGSGAAVLVAESRTAALTVVGSRGTGRLPGTTLGATATVVATHAAGPVVIARPPAALPGPDRPVVVGVDGSDHSVAALDLGFDVAQRTGAPVVAVHTWWDGPFAALADAGRETAAGAALAGALEPWRRKYPDVALTEKLAHGADPAEILVHESAGAGLLVVGTRGHGGFAGLLLGSVSLSVAQHAHCPVAVVRPQPPAA